MFQEPSAKEFSTDRAGIFATTHWSLIVSVQGPDSPESSAALEQLCRTYWPPLYAFARCRGHSPEDARDLTQQFFARLLEKDYLRTVHPARGKFRTFLLTAMQHFLANEWTRARRQKRGGGQVLFSLDDDSAGAAYGGEPADEMTAEKILDRRWAMTVLEVTMSNLAKECSAAGKAALFDSLKHTLAGEKSKNTMHNVADRLSMSEGAVKIALHRLRRRYGELLREEIARTVSRPEEIEEELRHLRAALRS
ncbi:RNA polymerase, sigma-24 subunit, ECF subfamily [Verrucomicrobia bacterium]|nr:RNA polymerase, sigma-24 subunit, ECF subfamily [Verrucomicrobiota bacterium]